MIRIAPRQVRKGYFIIRRFLTTWVEEVDQETFASDGLQTARPGTPAENDPGRTALSPYLRGLGGRSGQAGRCGGRHLWRNAPHHLLLERQICSRPRPDRPAG